MIKYKHSLTLVTLALLVASLVSCGVKSKSVSKAPNVIVINTVSSTANSSTATVKGLSSDLESKGGQYLQIQAVSGNITINGEAISLSVANISITDINGNIVQYTIEANGNIDIYSSGVIAGTYYISIVENDRVYNLVIVVDSNNNATVTIATSVVSGQSLALDLNGGILSSNGLNISITSVLYGKYIQDPTVSSISVKDSNGCVVSYTVDLVTGDITVTKAQNSYCIEIITVDGRDIKFTTNSYGQIIGGFTISGSCVALIIKNGVITAGTTTLTLPILNSSVTSWLISATAGASAAPVSVNYFYVDSATGCLKLEIPGTVIPPAGPYSFRVHIASGDYIITTDANGNVQSIIPGDVLLALTNGSLVFNGAALLIGGKPVTVESKSDSIWSIKTTVSAFNATTATLNTDGAYSSTNGTSISISVDPITGNFVSTSIQSGYVQIALTTTNNFGYGEVINYTVVEYNGNIVYYTAVLTNAGSGFDYSTVTGVQVYLTVADKVTGLGIPTASISFVDASGVTTWKGFTDATGKSLLSTTIASISTVNSIKVTHDGYTPVASAVNGVTNAIAFAKNITMTPIVPNPPVIDPSKTFNYITTTNTLIFEDQYNGSETFNALTNNGTATSGNDADFNDLALRMTVVEKIDGNNLIRATKITTSILAVASGSATNYVGIYVNGAQYMIINSDPHTLFENAIGYTWKGDWAKYNGGATVAYSYTKYPKLTLTPITIDFGSGVTRDNIGNAPYDPFMCHDNNSANLQADGHYALEEHLATAKTTYQGVISGNGYLRGCPLGSNPVAISNFVWVLCLPDGWLWPQESVCIGIAYPGFINWCNKKGTEDADWYNNPDKSQVVTQP